nr:MAG TPA: hypothetical protein [Crassvirales sp.]DAH00376.1 MAG TPA: hypothetical protein [Crassvirales sp.]
MYSLSLQLDNKLYNFAILEITTLRYDLKFENKLFSDNLVKNMPV